MSRIHRAVGRLLAALRLMHHLRQSHDYTELARVERCFAPDFSYVRKTRELDSIIRAYRGTVFSDASDI